MEPDLQTSLILTAQMEDIQMGSLTYGGGRLYGMTDEGGNNYFGCIFNVQTNGNGYTDLLDFDGQTYPQGETMEGSLTYSNGIAYGTSFEGGIAQEGNVFGFKINCTLTATASLTAATCSGGSNGVATANPGEGIPPYTYLWNNNQANASAIGLSAGTYSVTVTDFYGCTATAQTTITNAAAVGITANVTANNNCYGINTGSASTTTTHGVPPFTYTWNPSVSTNDTAVNLSAGTYTVTVNDACSNSATAPITITAPSALGGGATPTANDLCYGAAVGKCTALPTNGTTPYTYLWTDPNSQTTVEATGLTAGTYTVTITDACGATATANTSITQPSAALSANTSFTPAGCNGYNGSATVTSVNGGLGAIPYTYSWNDASSQTTATASNLSASTYTVTVQDNNGCSATASVAVTQPPPPTAYPTSTGIVCNGYHTGTASTNPTGGTTPYTYLWSPNASSQTTPTATGLSAGTYTISLSDLTGCTTSAPIIVTQPNAISASPTSPGVICHGGTTTATANPSGGTTPYTYQWSVNAGAQTTATATGLSAGTYTVGVGDACYSGTTAAVIVTQPNTLDASANASFNVSCNAGTNGSALSNASGGTSPYTYAWSTNSGSQTTAMASVLMAGTYTITISDACSNSATATATITQPLALSTTTYAGTSVAAVTPSGGVTPYTYDWTPVSGTTDTIKGLSLGTYSVTVTDANGCIKTASVDVTSATGTNKITSNSGAITVYPNPNNGMFTIQSSVINGQWSVEVYNVLGQQVYSTSNIQHSTFDIDLSSQPDGVYLYRVLTSTGSLLGQGKIVIQK